MKHLFTLLTLLVAVLTAGAVELPLTGGTLAGSTAYQVKTTVTLTRSTTLPRGSSIGVSEGGRLMLAKGVTLTCAEGSTLVVTDGLIGGEGQLTGRGAALSAPVARIFDEAVTVDGKWNIDRAYPQWFAPARCSDWSGPINAAIDMKGTGEVFLPRGTYQVRRTIYVNFGIRLVGDGGRRKEKADSSRVEATVITPAATGCRFNSDYMVMVNVKHTDAAGNETPATAESGTWEVNHPVQGTELCRLYFYDNSAARHLGVLAAGGLTAHQVVWNGTRQAIAFTNKNYSDHRTITQCVYYPGRRNTDYDASAYLYAFDLNSLGDAVVFEGNQVSEGDVNRGALRVRQSGGARITSNILNCDVEIASSKGVYYGSNHSESGAQVRVNCSTVKMESNFYEKGERPSVLIMGNNQHTESVVSMDSEMFGYYNGRRGRVFGGGKETVEEARQRMENINEDDIAIDRYSMLSLNNCYRYDIHCQNGAGTQFTYGVSIGQLDPKSREVTGAVSAFEEGSHYLSASGSIHPGLKVKSAASAPAPGKSRVYVYGPVAQLTWVGATGGYSYTYEIVDGDGNVTKNGTMDKNYDGSAIRLTNGDKGLLLCLAEADGAGKQLSITLTRRGPDGRKSVTVPMSGANNFYDNGVAIAGYPWR